MLFTSYRNLEAAWRLLTPALTRPTKVCAETQLWILGVLGSAALIGLAMLAGACSALLASCAAQQEQSDWERRNASLVGPAEEAIELPPFPGTIITAVRES